MPETTKNYHRVPARRKPRNAKLRTITIGKGIKALYDAKNKVIITYLFDKKKYTMKQAKKWVQDHKKEASHLQIVENLMLIDKINQLYDEAKKDIVNEYLNI